MDDQSNDTDQAAAPISRAWRLAPSVNFEDIRAANDNHQEPRPIETERGLPEMNNEVAVPFNDIEHEVFVSLAADLHECALVGDVTTEQTDEGADFLVVVDLHDNPLLIVEKHGADIWLMWSDTPRLGDCAKCIHGTAQTAADAVLEFVTFPRHP